MCLFGGLYQNYWTTSQCLKSPSLSIFPNIAVVLNMLLIIPVTSDSMENSNSTVKKKNENFIAKYHEPREICCSFVVVRSQGFSFRH